MEVLRTPDERFSGIEDFPWEPRFVDVGGLRLHHIDEGPRSAAPVLLLHGEPSWSYLWRRVIRVLLDSGLRTVALDLAGFGRSDKPASRQDHTYARHVAWVGRAVDALGLRDITLVCHDWGGLIGLRLVADAPERFARVVASNTGLPTGDIPMPGAFRRWQEASQAMDPFLPSVVLQLATLTDLPAGVLAAYDAPFPEQRYAAAPRQLPLLVPTNPDDEGAVANRAAWEALRRFERPFLCAYSDRDPVTRGAERLFIEQVPGCAGLDHPVIHGAGHFLQEDRGEELGAVVARFVRSTPGPG